VMINRVNFRTTERREGSRVTWMRSINLGHPGNRHQAIGQPSPSAVEWILPDAAMAASVCIRLSLSQLVHALPFILQAFSGYFSPREHEGEWTAIRASRMIVD